MHGNDVRSVFEAATGHRVLVKDWWRTTLSDDPVRQQVWISGTNTWTNKQVYLESPSFTDGDIEAAAANLGRDYAAAATATPTPKLKGITEMVSSARTGIQAARSAASDLGASTAAFVTSAESSSFNHGDIETAAADLGRDYAAGDTSTQEPIAMSDTAGLTNALKIKGLTEMVSSARAGIQAARSAASDLGASTSAFVASAAEVKKQIDAARSDLEFEATQLSNESAAQ